MATRRKAYKGLPMEGVIASWYARNTGRDARRFQTVADLLERRLAPGARVLEVAPGPGYLAIELARRGYRVSAVDISRSFVRLVGENAARAGVEVEVKLGDAAHLPLPDGSFDYVVCMAAFKNFTDPVGALDEMQRVLRPGGEASIFDLRKDASPEAIATEVATMNLSGANAALTRWIFRTVLLKNAHTRAQLEEFARRSRFGSAEIAAEGVGFELRLRKAA